MRGQSTFEADDGATPSERVGILGFRKSGKSTYLAVLSDALTYKGSDWDVTPYDHTTEKRMIEITRRVKNDGLYPRLTLEREAFEDDLVFKVERRARLWGWQEGDIFHLRADDIPGSSVLGIAGTDVAYTGFYDEYVKHCTAIIFLIDPQHKWLVELDSQERGKVKEGEGPYYFVFTTILNQLIRLHGDNLIVAFCITKLDEEPDGYKYFEDSGDQTPDEYIEEKAIEILGEVVKTYIDNKLQHNPVRWFGVSATGYYMDADGQRRTQHTQKLDPTENKMWAAIARPNEVRPLGVAESAEWVFDRVAERHIRGRRKKSQFFQRFRPQR